MPAALKIRHDPGTAGGEFTLELDGVRVGELVYSLAGDRLTIRHTGVDPALRGQGAARKLVDAAVQFAREERLKVASRCSYASAVFARTPAAFADVLAD